MSSKEDKSSLAPRASVRPVPRDHLTAYSFEGFRSVSVACRELVRRGFSGESSLYKCISGKYYLFIRESSSDIKKSSFCSFLSELGELENVEYAHILMSEHGRIICKDHAAKKISEI